MVRGKHHPTRSEWERSIRESWREGECAICGNRQPWPEVDEEGYVWQYCPVCDVIRCLARENLPSSFAPEPDQSIGDPGELPF